MRSSRSRAPLTVRGEPEANADAGASRDAIQLRLVVVPILVATLLASAMTPTVQALKRRGVPRALAPWVALLTAMTAIGTVAAVVVAGIRGEWAELTASASDGLVELQDLLVSGPLPTRRRGRRRAEARHR